MAAAPTESQAWRQRAKTAETALARAQAALVAADRLADAASRITVASKPAMGDIVEATAAYRKLRGQS